MASPIVVERHHHSIDGGVRASNAFDGSIEQFTRAHVLSPHKLGGPSAS
jgi:hypothetical protein